MPRHPSCIRAVTHVISWSRHNKHLLALGYTVEMEKTTVLGGLNLNCKPKTPNFFFGLRSWNEALHPKRP